MSTDSKRKWWHLGRSTPSAPATRTPPALTAPELVEAPVARAFKAARPGRLAGGFGFLGAPGVSSRDETRRDLRGLLAHARYAAQNIDYVRSYEMMVRRHVIGRAGIALQMDVRDPGGAVDRVANDRIESAWASWGRRGSVTPCGRLSWWNVENIAATMVAREGNCLLRIYRGPGFGPFGFQIAPISFDLLDLDYSGDLRDGRFIRGGIEFDSFGRPLAYHLWTAHPAETQGIGTRRRVRVDAEAIIHVWRPNEAGQEFGVPQAHTALRRFNMLSRYEESALAAAHYGAAVAAFFTQEADDSPSAGTEADEIPDEITPGMTAMLPPGVDIANWQPNYPDGEMPAFNKAMLRGGAAGLGVSYAGLTSDMEGANFSSLRDGRGEERDEWRMFQRDIAETLHAEVFRRWLPFGLAVAGLPLVKVDTFDAALWRPRSWPSVNPKDDAAANEADLRNGLKAPSQIVAERGEDFEGMVRRLAADLAMLREAGVPIPAVLTGAAGSSASAAPAAPPARADDPATSEQKEAPLPELKIPVRLYRAGTVERAGTPPDPAGADDPADTDAPNGLKDYAASVNAVDFAAAGAPTWAELVAMEAAIAADDADVDSMAYIFNAALRGYLKQTPKVSGHPVFLMGDDKLVNGYASIVSNQAVAGDLWLGKWADFVIGMWSGSTSRSTPTPPPRPAPSASSRIRTSISRSGTPSPSATAA